MSGGKKNDKTRPRTEDPVKRSSSLALVLAVLFMVASTGSVFAQSTLNLLGQQTSGAVTNPTATTSSLTSPTAATNSSPTASVSQSNGILQLIVKAGIGRPGAQRRCLPQQDQHTGEHQLHDIFHGDLLRAACIIQPAPLFAAPAPAPQCPF